MDRHKSGKILKTLGRIGMIITNFPLILASGSQIRKKILENAALSFSIIKPLVDEEAYKIKVSRMPFIDQALELAVIKGMSVSKVHTKSFVIAADQVCALDSENRIFNKPGSFETAVNHLKSLRGKTHSQNSGICLLYNGEVIWRHTQRAIMSMRHLSDIEINSYVSMDKPFEACGAYQLESSAKHLFKKIEGSDDNILGLPLSPLLNELYERNIISLC